MLFWVFYGLPVVMRGMGISISIDHSGARSSPWPCPTAPSPPRSSARAFKLSRVGKLKLPQTIGLSRAKAMRYVILPQAVRRILPPLANQFIYIVKMSAFASVIGMQELTRRANELVVTEYRPLEIYTLLILEYLVLVLIISAGVRWLERRMGADESR